MNSNLLTYAKNIYSQAGQDGIIEHIFNVLGIKKGNFVEFGSWDGIYLSNCRKLFKEGWSGVFIESDKSKFLELQKNYESSKQVICINKKVQVSGPNKFDNIISEYAPDKPITFLSIDIDGCDLEIFESIEKYLPLAVCIEGGKAPHPLDPKMPSYCIQNIGQSLNTIKETAENKGYKILCAFQDVFLIKNHLLEKFNPPSDLFELYINGYKGQEYLHIPMYAGRLKKFYRKNILLDYILKETKFFSKYKIYKEGKFAYKKYAEWAKDNDQQITNILDSFPQSLYLPQVKNSEKTQICLVNNFLRVLRFIKDLTKQCLGKRLCNYIESKLNR